MDELRKLVSGRLRTQVAGPHPDPDALAAFAENALLEAERAQLLQHLGACHDCREILYLAAPDFAQRQEVLSFQPKRRSGLVFRWGALVASVVIVGTAVIINRPMLRRAPHPAVATAPASSDINIAEEKVPAEVESTRDHFAPAPPPALKERPAAKRMTAKPQAGLEFDDSDQVRLSQGALAKQDKKSSNDELATAGGNAWALPTPLTSQTVPESPTSAGTPAKDKSGGRADYAYANRSAGERAATASNPGGAIGGTISDLSGAVVGNAKVTVSGPVGTETAISDPNGRFAFNALTPGVYSVKAEANGFKAAEVKEIAVLDKRSATIGVRLEPGKASETVEVSAAVIANEAADTASSAAPAQAANGLVLSQKQASAQGGLQKAMVINSPERGKASGTARPIPQWTLSAEGAVQRSLDFGKSWQKVTVPGASQIRALSTVGPHVWAGGNGGRLYHSADSGQSWNQIIPVSADHKLTADITHIEFSDPLNGSVSAVNGEVWSTSDGGQTWRRR